MDLEEVYQVCSHNRISGMQPTTAVLQATNCSYQGHQCCTQPSSCLMWPSVATVAFDSISDTLR